MRARELGKIKIFQYNVNYNLFYLVPIFLQEKKA